MTAGFNSTLNLVCYSQVMVLHHKGIACSISSKYYCIEYCSNELLYKMILLLAQFCGNTLQYGTQKRQ